MKYTQRASYQRVSFPLQFELFLHNFPFFSLSIFPFCLTSLSPFLLFFPLPSLFPSSIISKISPNLSKGGRLAHLAHPYSYASARAQNGPNHKTEQQNSCKFKFNITILMINVFIYSGKVIGLGLLTIIFHGVHFPW